MNSEKPLPKSLEWDMMSSSGEMALGWVGTEKVRVCPDKSVLYQSTWSLGG